MEFLEDRKHAPRKLGRVLVLGLGKSGHDVAEYCLRLLGTRVEGLYIAAGQPNDRAQRLADRARAEGARAIFGEGAVRELAALAHGRFDVCVASPGIPPRDELYQDALAVSDEVISEVEFAWRESARGSRWVAVTGTNGKTTVTSLIDHILRGAGMASRAVGNIGDTCTSAVEEGGFDVYVAETSSFQLASIADFAPDVSVLLNITPDHLYWHGSLEAYRDAKLRILENLPQMPGAVAVLDATNDIVREQVRRLRAQDEASRGFAYVPVGTAGGLSGDMRAACGSDNAAFVGSDGTLLVAFGGHLHSLGNRADLLIKGEHNVGNALVAAAAAIAMGASDESVKRGLATFKPLEHRIEPCGSIQGAACYNDSKATNVDATLKAFAAFPEARPIVLLGGKDKGTDLAPLVAAAHRHSRAVVCFGAARERFAAAFTDAAGAEPADFSLLEADHLADALDEAVAIAHAGDVILLSPACASFDEFSCFEERGDVFKKLVADRAASLGA